ncbi:hypothetical protein TNCV_3892081 [Trichonephila clavipes]|nr:hypothetical protein TNCV_3892081 [Trichonephila clavipes]
MYRIALREVGTCTQDPKQCHEKIPPDPDTKPLYSSNLACRIHGFMSQMPYSQPPVGIKNLESRLITPCSRPDLRMG